MLKKLISYGFILSILLGGFILAQELEAIVFPVEELGNCQNEAECRSYCDNIAHLEECLNFAEEHNLMEQTELQEAKQILQAIKAGAKLPGGCTSEVSCQAYCQDPSHMSECLDFAEAAGFVTGQELKEARQVAKALEAGLKTPGNCWGKEACDAYCQEPAHIEECVEFALAAGLIPADEAEEVRKILPLMKAGQMPGGCMDKEECEAYCQVPDNMEECMEFAAKAGLMTEEELEMYKKTGGKGPGGCRSEEECETFCNKPVNQKTCFQFGVEHGLIPEEELSNLKEGIAKMQEALQSAPPEVMNCLQTALGAKTIAEIESGEVWPTEQMGEQFQNCFEQYRPEMPSPGEGLPSEAGQLPADSQQGLPQGKGMPAAGPGGCTSQEECEEYCSVPAHFEECLQFGPRP